MSFKVDRGRSPDEVEKFMSTMVFDMEPQQLWNYFQMRKRMILGEPAVGLQNKQRGVFANFVEFFHQYNNPEGYVGEFVKFIVDDLHCSVNGNRVTEQSFSLSRNWLLQQAAELFARKNNEGEAAAERAAETKRLEDLFYQW